MTRKVSLKLVCPTEDQEQIRFATWLQKKGIRFAASGNGGSRNLWEAVKLKKMGLSPGFPDIEIPLPVGIYHGLYIELKRTEGSRVAEAQTAWLNYLNEKGYYARVAYGADQAIEITELYLLFGKDKVN